MYVDDDLVNTRRWRSALERRANKEVENLGNYHAPDRTLLRRRSTAVPHRAWRVFTPHLPPQLLQELAKNVIDFAGILAFHRTRLSECVPCASFLTYHRV